MEGRKFDLAVVLAIAKNRGLADMDSQRKALNYMTNRYLTDAMLKTAYSCCRWWLLTHYEQFIPIDVPLERREYSSWIKAQKKRFGDTLTVWPLPLDVWSKAEEDLLRRNPDAGYGLFRRGLPSDK